MVELLLTFPEAVKDDIGKYLEKQRLDVAKQARSRPNQMLSKVYQKAFGCEIHVIYTWKYLSNTTAQISFNSNVKLDAETLKKGVQMRFIDGVVNVEIIPEKTEAQKNA